MTRQHTTFRVIQSANAVHTKTAQQNGQYWVMIQRLTVLILLVTVLGCSRASDSGLNSNPIAVNNKENALDQLAGFLALASNDDKDNIDVYSVSLFNTTTGQEEWKVEEIDDTAWREFQIVFSGYLKQIDPSKMGADLAFRKIKINFGEFEVTTELYTPLRQNGKEFSVLERLEQSLGIKKR